MKTIIVCLASLLLSVMASAQLKTTPKCPSFDIDILHGIVNQVILPTSTVGQIKLNLPCFTSFEEEGTSAKCGAGVFYKDKDIYFYTTRDYIEIGPAFKGKLSIPLLGASRNSLFKWLGTPQIKDVTWDAFQTAYGVLILYYNNASKVDKIQFSTQTANTIHLCE
ncbi:hypothetical protein FW778_11440 [Ginsengibacter hankyongi]|uniref:Uncharacterized protein n=1 Tax=Ginsengibacter hankyongi TaxID=2607284 RepID=A0A5J5IIM3_9BACT|nr:hypothetical protein [Ginsengibacter hankyongi]KAA9039428.1 hypothetical protein FW778_11440 [Ginsengibacter hankyongi]